MNAFFTSPSKIFESVNAKTGHLVSDLNQKLDISGKLDSIKQASVGTLEQVVRGSSSVVVNRSDSKDVPQREEIIAGENAVKPSDIDSPSFYNKSKADFDVAHSTKSTSQFSPAHQSQTSSSTAAGGGSSSSGLRRQSTQNTPRPPRPPPPSSAALSRAMSLDENNLSAQMKTIRKGQPTDEQSDDSHRMKYSGKDRLLSSKAIEESCILQQPDALVIEEEENSSASEYGENGDQPIYRPESELPIPADKQTSISISHAKSPASSSKSAAVRDEEQKETSSSAYRLTSTEPSGTNIEEIQEFMELYASALIIGR
ncbi:unnamed protein product [Trichobilharzia regenti]|nr:unnamed protein product [Trichobilharzia regenti]